MRKMFTSGFINYFRSGTLVLFFNSDKNGGVLGKLWKMLFYFKMRIWCFCILFSIKLLKCFGLFEILYSCT